MADPRVFGATPLDHVAKKRAPTRGAAHKSDESDKSDGSDILLKYTKLCSIPASARMPIARVSQSPFYTKCRLSGGCPTGDPGRGPFVIARMSRHTMSKTPGYHQYALYIQPRQGVALTSQAIGATPRRGRGLFVMTDPRVFRATLLDHVALTSLPDTM